MTDKLDALLDAMGFTPGEWWADSRGEVMTKPVGAVKVARTNGSTWEEMLLNSKLLAASRELLKGMVRTEFEAEAAHLGADQRNIDAIEAACPWTWKQIVEWMEANE